LSLPGKIFLGNKTLAQVSKILGVSVMAIGLVACQGATLKSKKSVVGQPDQIVSTANFKLVPDATYRSLADLQKVPAVSEVKVCREYQADIHVSDLKDYVSEKLKNYRRITGGNSLTTNNHETNDLVRQLVGAATIANVRNADDIAGDIIGILARFARSEALLDTISPHTASTMKCWKSAGSQCPFHHAQLAAELFTAATHTAILLKRWLDNHPDRQVIDDWLAAGYPYMKGVADLMGTGPNKGVYSYMNGKSSVLLYALYKNDAALFLRYSERGINQILQRVDESGYIDNNSFRGTRKLWYHSLALDAIFGFGELLETQGIEFFDRPDLKARLENSYVASLRGARDYSSFDKGNRGYNYITDEKRGRKHLHQDGTALMFIGGHRFRETGTLPDAHKFKKSNFDYFNGIEPQCFFADRLGVFAEEFDPAD
jgi:hypothetical protein